jgi:hypothetical protein
MSYRDILAFYYGGLKPKRYREPDTIRVGIATGLRAVTIAPEGPVTFAGEGPADGPWLVRGGKRIRVSPGEPPTSRIEAGALVRVPQSARSGRELNVTVDVPQRSVVSVVASVDGEDVTLIRPHTVEAGTVALDGVVPDIASGTFAVRAVVTDGIDIVSTEARGVRFHGVTPPGASPSPTSGSPSPPTSSPAAAAVSDDGGGLEWTLVAGAIGAGIVVGVALGGWWRARRRPRGPHGF